LLTSLILGRAGLAEGRAHVAEEEDGLLVGFATWIETVGTMELEDLFVDPGYMRHVIAAALGQGHDSASTEAVCEILHKAIPRKRQGVA
jgi:GNAT superfamily N-acetyltransferase